MKSAKPKMMKKEAPMKEKMHKSKSEMKRHEAMKKKKDGKKDCGY